MAISRRQFIKRTTATSIGAGLALSVSPSLLAGPKQPENLLGKVENKKKSLVFIMLDGGNDSYNMLVPTSDKHYREYKETRSNLALAKHDLLPLDGYQDKHGRSFGIHPSMPELQQLFAKNKLAFIANIGPMIEPINKRAFYSGGVELPLGLMSHADQFKHWQTARPNERTNRGWFGYLADSLQSGKRMEEVPMGISLAGSNIMQSGLQSSPYAITDDGSVGLFIKEQDSDLNKTLLNYFEQSLNMSYPGDPFKLNYQDITRKAQAVHEVFSSALESIKVQTVFESTSLSQQLKIIARTIKAADNLGHMQQTFFVRYIGWDHHDELLNNHAHMLKVLSQALGSFQICLEELGVADQVITFTGSDFGRTLTSNGNGTDHGWGGNTIVIGNNVNGGCVYGDYPSLLLGEQNPLDIGGGVLIPSLSIDELYAELALWFGVNDQQLYKLFPNLKNFVEPGKKTGLSGIIKY
ncbi:DUF1501 domain-containing protein [Vibrio alginolyticus]|nr:DUF1501 domain-containing protein [Vibrio alginolyticus]EMD1213672.1 DUF1501 domain-containing protein [Vibrio alginolyticus]